MRYVMVALFFYSTLSVHAAELDAPSKRPAEQAQFFSLLKQNCGAIFSGQSVFPQDANDAFANQELVATIASCTDQEIRVPFAVGSDQSRTWIIRWQGEQLELKHDHRHADGSPDDVTMYGGLALQEGHARAQAFQADAYTAQLIPAAATNVWTISISEEHHQLTYYLERDGRPRFKAILQRKPVP